MGRALAAQSVSRARASEPPRPQWQPHRCNPPQAHGWLTDRVRSSTVLDAQRFRLLRRLAETGKPTVPAASRHRCPRCGARSRAVANADQECASAGKLTRWRHDVVVGAVKVDRSPCPVSDRCEPSRSPHMALLRRSTVRIRDAVARPDRKSGAASDAST